MINVLVLAALIIAALAFVWGLLKIDDRDFDAEVRPSDSAGAS